MLCFFLGLFAALNFYGLSAAEVAVGFNLTNSPKEAVYTEGQPSIQIVTVTPGNDIQQVSDSSCRFTLNTNKKGGALWVSITPDLPSGVSVYLTIDTLSGALQSGSCSSVSRVLLGSTQKVCIDQINKAYIMQAPMIYECQTSVTAGPISLSSYTITFTLID